MIQIIANRNIWLSVSGVIFVLALAALSVWGFNYGIDFTGGALLEVRYQGERPEVTAVRERFEADGFTGVVVQPVDASNLVVRYQDSTEERHQQALKLLDGFSTASGTATQSAGVDVSVGQGTATIASSSISVSGSIEELRFDSVGPTIGAELKRRTLTAVSIAIIGMIAFIAWSFRAVSKPVASWKFGVAAIVALLHDTVITMGIFAVLGHYYGIEVNTPFVAAILTVLGYSVNDTIIVFDRIRENLPKSGLDFEGTVNVSLNQTLSRSVKTSFTVMLALAAILFFGGSTIRDFVLALLIGVAFGTFSSIFIASPLLVVWEKWQRRSA